MTSLDQLIFLILSILMTVFFVGLSLVGFKEKRYFMGGFGFSMAIIFSCGFIGLLVFAIGLGALLAIVLSCGFVGLLLFILLMFFERRLIFL